MRTKERYDAIIDYFERAMPEAESELNFSSPFELLVAVILSAQCTDKRVNMVTPTFFATFPTPQALAEASVEEVYDVIRSISYPNNKAKNLVGMAKMLLAEFDGEVPSDIEQMMRLPGVGRKTANVVGAVIWQREVMPVDTHVFRVSHRIGLVPQSAKTPYAVEQYLERHIAAPLLPKAHHWLILHGRYTCTARKPKCEECGISSWCRRFARLEKNSYLCR
ncbi:MAG: endonuclease III [Alistipes sp.]|nr:endonuclease III [Alistipes sp.]